MSATRQLLLSDVDYSAWANQQLLAVCSALTRDQLIRDLGASHRSILETLRHIFYAERVWRDRLLKNRLPPLIEDKLTVNGPKRVAVWDGKDHDGKGYYYLQTGDQLNTATRVATLVPHPQRLPTSRGRDARPEKRPGNAARIRSIIHSIPSNGYSQNGNPENKSRIRGKFSRPEK